MVGASRASGELARRDRRDRPAGRLSEVLHPFSDVVEHASGAGSACRMVQATRMYTAPGSSADPPAEVGSGRMPSSATDERR